MFASVLRDYGIACMVQADDCGGVRPYMAVTGGVRVLVNDDEYGEAVRILDQLHQEES